MLRLDILLQLEQILSLSFSRDLIMAYRLYWSHFCFCIILALLLCLLNFELQIALLNLLERKWLLVTGI